MHQLSSEVYFSRVPNLLPKKKRSKSTTGGPTSNGKTGAACWNRDFTILQDLTRVQAPRSKSELKTHLSATIPYFFGIVNLLAVFVACFFPIYVFFPFFFPGSFTCFLVIFSLSDLSISSWTPEINTCPQTQVPIRNSGVLSVSCCWKVAS